VSPLARIGLVVAGVGAFAVLAGRRKVASVDDGADDEQDDPPGDNSMFQNDDKAIAVGEATDPGVAPLLEEIQANWDRRGIPRAMLTPAKFYTMTKATHVDGPDDDDDEGPVLAIASRATWANTENAVADLFVPIMQDVEAHGGKRSDYRIGGFREGHGSDGKGKGSYNAATGGAGKSRHVDGDAFDIIPIRAVTKNTDVLLLAIARLKVRNPKAPIGFGAYKGNGHVDLGGNRMWSGKTVPGKAEKYIAKAKAELNIT